MAKCPMCDRKAKRQCELTETSMICSACCGSSRKKATCDTCIYYQEPKRNYKKLPAYTPSEMNRYLNLPDISDVIESAICTYDFEYNCALKDNVAIRIIELVLDKIHFKDSEPQETDEIAIIGYGKVLAAIQKKLPDTCDDVLIKILGAIYFVAKRRTQGNREYLDIIKPYVGVNTGSELMKIIERELL